MKVCEELSAEQKNNIDACTWGTDRAAQEYRAIKTRLPNSWGTEGIGL